MEEETSLPTVELPKAFDNTPVVAEPEKPSPEPLPLIKAVRAADVRNPWMCNTCGAILGSVYHEKIRQGLSLSRLILFRGAVKFDENLPENFIFGKVDAGEFGCSRCGTVRHWHPSPEVLLYLSDSRKKVRKNNRNK